MISSLSSLISSGFASTLFLYPSTQTSEKTALIGLISFDVRVGTPVSNLNLAPLNISQFLFLKFSVLSAILSEYIGKTNASR
ncbi:hypothetical protein D3C72_1736300 [compost metagenome]